MIGSHKAEVDRVLDLLAPLSTAKCGLLATAYNAWNDLLSRGTSPNDRDIIAECRHRWHESKKAIAEKSWFWALRFLTASELTPKHTAAHGATM